jgi:hypothetical protein
MINRGDPAFVVDFVHSEDSTVEYWVVERLRNPFCNTGQTYYKEIFRKRQLNIGSFCSLFLHGSEPRGLATGAFGFHPSLTV